MQASLGSQITNLVPTYLSLSPIITENVIIFLPLRKFQKPLI